MWYAEPAPAVAGQDEVTLANVLGKKVPPIQDLVPDLPSALSSVLHACLSRNPVQRPRPTSWRPRSISRDIRG
jgi:hypothetical protein